MGYTRIEIWRDGAISQIIEINLNRKNPSRYLRLWFLRISDLEPDNNFVVKVKPGEHN